MATLREARRSARLTLQHIADRLGTSRQYVHRAEKGLSAVNPAKLATWRAALGLSILLLFTACADECDHEPTVAELCDLWAWGGSIVDTGDGLRHVPELDAGDLGFALCQ